VLLAGCVPVPGAGWSEGGGGGNVVTPSTAGPLETSRSAPGGPTCPGPLEGPIRRAADGVSGTLRDAGGGTASTELSDAGIDLVLVSDTEAGLLTFGGASRTEHACAARVVVAPADDLPLRTLAAAWAALDGLPLVLTPREALVPAEGAALAGRLAALGVTEVLHLGDPPPWIGGPDIEARAVDLLAASSVDGTGVMEAALTLAAIVEERTGRAELVVMLAEDLTSQADLAAHARSGSVPITLPLLQETAHGAVALLSMLLGGDLPYEVRWAASSIAHAQRLDALLDEVIGASDEAPDVGSRDSDRPARWHAPDRGDGPRELWLGDVRDPVAALHTAVAAVTRGATFVAVDGAELRSGVARTERMRSAIGAAGAPLATEDPTDAPTVVLVGEREEHTDWQLATVLTGTPLPGGGFLPLEEQRIVALYGSPGAPTLGLLGRQDDVATITLAREYAAGYVDADDGRTVVPGLDVIVTVASGSAEPTGDYSRRVPIARLRPLVDLAREEGVAVLLDLQPGRTDFLTQAQEYAELLREPHVHLALDPEWRIGPRERHLTRIGSVEAAEVQAVADWLAALVREERLPQKVLMLHQFTLGMLPDRDTVVIPPELVGVVHMDGQGSLPAKERTYATITAGAAEQWAWGWKNFTRIDRPLATPERTLARVPVPVIVSYQ
jgi:hypothetical protein